MPPQASEYKTVTDLNPRSKPVKDMEMTVVRAINLIKAFEEAPGDWSTVKPSAYRDNLGESMYPGMRKIETLWERWKKKTLHREVADLIENLPLANLSKERRKLINAFLRKHKDLLG